MWFFEGMFKGELKYDFTIMNFSYVVIFEWIIRQYRPKKKAIPQST